MKKRVYNIKISYIVYIVFMIITLLISVVYAAYTNSSFRKGVVSTNGSSQLFSSDILNGYISDYDSSSSTDLNWIMMFNEDENQNNIELTINVYNHAEDNKNVPNNKEIQYNISFQLIGSNESLLSQYKVNNHSFTTNELILENNILFANELSTNSFTLTIPYIDAENVQILVEARPNESYLEATDNYLLARRLIFNKETQNVKFSWSGSLSDIQTGNSIDYVAFNYVISGSGEGVVTLTWDKTYLELDQFFINSQDGTLSEDNSSFTFAVNSNITDYYMIQFFRIKNPNADETWDNIKNKITFTVIETTQTS